MTNLSETTNDQLQILKDFANAENKQLVEELEAILRDVAKTGQYIYPWHFMKPLYACKLAHVTSEFLAESPPLKLDGTKDEEEIEKLEDFRDKLLQLFDKFVCAPFTFQRVSEMLTEPRKHYKSTGKFFRGLEKNILVVSTIDPVSAEQRPSILKRSFYDENPMESKLNEHVVNTDLKPQLKKIHLEENLEDGNQLSVVDPLSEKTVEKEKEIVSDFLDAKDENPEKKDGNPEGRDANLEAKDANSEEKDTNPEMKDANPVMKDANPEMKDASSEMKDASSEMKDANPDTKDANLETKDANLETKDANLETKDANLETKDANLETMDTNQEIMDTNSETMDTNPETMDASPETMDASPGKMDASPGKMDANPETIDAISNGSVHTNSIESTNPVSSGNTEYSSIVINTEEIS